ncbi:MAG: malate synthase A, partial [Luteibaculum sp.]
AEISRAQLWQWLKHNARLNDGRIVTRELLESIFYEEQLKVRDQLENTVPNRLENASILFRDLIFSTEFKTFLTLEAYELI